MMETDAILAEYRRQGPMTEPGEYAEWLTALPDDVAGTVRAVQGLLVHIFWASAYHLELSEERQGEVTLRPMRRKLPRLLELDPASLSTPRPPERRLVGNCRDFTVFTVAVLRSHGIPARSRCGFGTYFTPNHYEDHWVLDTWDFARRRWVMVDSQLDSLQQEALHLSFDPLDLPEGAFVNGGQAWLLARRGEANPDDFGIFEMKGIDFIKGNLFRDLAALNKFEALPWDDWGWIARPAAEMSSAELALLDRAAEVCAQNDAAAAQVLYRQTELFRPPAEWAA